MNIIGYHPGRDPSACLLQDGLRTFWSTGLDALAIGSFLVAKPGVGVPAGAAPEPA